MRILPKRYWTISFFYCLVSFSLQAQLPGVVKVDHYLVDRDEVSNLAWLEFIHYIEKDSGLVYAQSMYPDSVNTTWRDPDKRECPINFIGYEQALAYCQWRSDVVSQKFSDQRVVYRLPSPYEWEKIAKQYYTNERGVFNKKFTLSIRKLKKWNRRQKKIFFQCGETKEDKLMNLLGNMSEMTSEQGVAIGWNYGDLSTVNESFATVITYEQPSKYIGFRCIAEVLAK